MIFQEPLAFFKKFSLNMFLNKNFDVIQQILISDLG